MWTIEAEELKNESYGVELLQTVGFIYSSKSKCVPFFLTIRCTALVPLGRDGNAPCNGRGTDLPPPRRHYLASTGPIPFGVGGWFHAAKSTAHIFNATVSTVRSAVALKSVYEAIQKAEAEGVSDEERRKLEDRAAQMGLNALFKVRSTFSRFLLSPRTLTDSPFPSFSPFPGLRTRSYRTPFSASPTFYPPLYSLPDSSSNRAPNSKSNRSFAKSATASSSPPPSTRKNPNSPSPFFGNAPSRLGSLERCIAASRRIRMRRKDRLQVSPGERRREEGRWRRDGRGEGKRYRALRRGEGCAYSVLQS
jgi:hypothetical protein